MRAIQKWKSILITTVGTVCLTTQVNAAEFGENTPYYEDDGWLDITEWLDGNDYNPTDEAWWRFDDETYQAYMDNSGDRDSDSWYGYTTRDDNDWYYDYYDPYSYSYYDYDRDDLFEFGSRYYDYNNDGFYDAVSYATDSDNDGIYDDYDYYSFGLSGSDNQKQQAANQSKSGSSRQQTVTGEIENTKLVQVRGGEKHVVVSIKPQQGQGQQTLIADLGKASDLKNVDPKRGEKITLKGPKAQVGDKQVVMARSVTLDGQTKQIDRNQQTLTAKVIDTRKANIRGQEHLLAIVQSSKGGTANKIAVDLGPADRLKVKVDKGSTLTVSGFPVKVKDRPLMMAQSVRTGGQFVQINRQSTAMGGSESAAEQEAGAASTDASTNTPSSTSTNSSSNQ